MRCDLRFCLRRRTNSTCTTLLLGSVGFKGIALEPSDELVDADLFRQHE
jgi:hypothetical protein